MNAKKVISSLEAVYDPMPPLFWTIWDGTGDALDTVSRPIRDCLSSRKEQANLTQPPGPKGHFIVGEGLEFLQAGPFDFFNKIWETYHHLGPVIKVPIFSTTNYVVTDPFITRRVLQHSRQFTRANSFDVLRLFLGNSVLTSEGKVHTQKKRELLEFLHQEKVTDYAPAMQTIAESLRQDWFEKIYADIPLNIHEEMMQTALTIMGETLLGTTSISQSNALKEPLKFILKFVSNNVLSPGFNLLGRHYLNVPTQHNRDFLKHLSVMENEIKRIIQQTSQSTDSQETYLSQQKRKHGIDPNHPTPSKELIQDLLTIFIAGHETTSQSLSFLFEELAFSQDVQSRLVEEIHNVLGSRLPTLSDLEHMPYLNQVIEANFLKNPPVYMSARDVLEEAILQDQEGNAYRFEKGSRILISPYLIQRDPRNWPDNTFNPDLFEDPVRRGVLPSERYNDFSMPPFLGGAHRCPGRFFARQELRILLIELVRHFHFTPASASYAPKHVIGTLQPKTAIFLNVTARNPTSVRV